MHGEGSRDMGNMSKKDKQLLLSLTSGIQVKHTRMTLKQKEDYLRRGRGPAGDWGGEGRQGKCNMV